LRRFASGAKVAAMTRSDPTPADAARAEREFVAPPRADHNRTQQPARDAPAAERRLAGRIALITGASRGIGKAVALRFAAEGAELVLLARSQGALEEVDDAVRTLGGHASLVPGDLADEGLIERVGAAVYERWGRLDILIGNAGVLGTLGPVGHVTPETWRRVLDVNLTANWRLIRVFDPLLRASPEGRAVFVTSSLAGGRAYWGAYAASKGGLEAMVRSYAEEVAHTSVRVALIDPGPTRTRMRALAKPGEDPMTLKPPDDDRVMDAFMRVVDPTYRTNGELIAL
jgi:NAD(P)-dependent dehydrogenase (short-subunit alcohol dehydrogenase family)